MKLKKLTLIFTIFIIVINLLRPASFAVTSTESDIQIYSDGAVLMESSTGKLLYGKNENEKRKMASTTKILTAIITIENSTLSDIVTISSKAEGTGGSRLGLHKDDKISVADLLYGLMLCSGNDAAVALAEHISGSVGNCYINESKSLQNWFKFKSFCYSSWS